MRNEAVPTGSLRHSFESSVRDLLYTRGTSQTYGGGGVGGAPAPEVNAGISLLLTAVTVAFLRRRRRRDSARASA